MKPNIFEVAPSYNLGKCISCEKFVSSLEHDCETQTFIYTKEEVQEIRKKIEG